VRKGDLVLGYQATPDKKLAAIARISREMFTNDSGEPTIEISAVAKIDNGLTYDDLQRDDILRTSEPMRFRCQGTLFAITEDEFDHLAALLTERDPGLRKHLEGGESVGPLTRLTFHASYSYEDFIEGYRPVDSKGGQLSLRLEDGIFKRVCREAQANPKKPYLVFIDEINRANVAKVFGELITLLEKDKRGLMVSLPQSKEPFTIPPNVYVLATMNTADRSIKLLDAALRRRFAFVELMPDPSLLEGRKFGSMALDEFLTELNRRIAEKEGREKQIGHSFLMDGDGPIADQDEFARRFRQEILPLLQEYCYDDYRVLATYIGQELVDQEGQLLNDEKLADPDQLIEALEKEFGGESEAT
jgi:5-methylcytosine-specific restriction protein B